MKTRATRCVLQMIALLAALSCSPHALAQQTAPPAVTLFENVRIFDGKRATLSAPTNVLIRGGLIERISNQPIPTDRSGRTTLIDGGGRTLMPGLIDAHAHVSIYDLPNAVLMTADPNYQQIRQAASAKHVLLAGFTSVRDMGGPVFGLKRAIDEGLVQGPRIWPSGAMISQTSGHGEYRLLNQLPGAVMREPPAGVRFGHQAMADGVPAVLTAVREQLMQGATQIKLAVGGGVMSAYDPIDVTEYSLDELKAAVGAAEDWGTYVAVHGYTVRSVRRAIEAGVKCIEHGQLLDEATLKLMAEKGIWLSTQPFLGDQDRIPMPVGSAGELRYKEVATGTDRAYTLAKKYRVKTAFGTDMLQNPNAVERIPFYLPKLTQWYTPAEVLKMATADNAELLALAGSRNPYPGKLGVVEEGALADLLLVDGDPLSNIKLLEDPARNLLVIMKDGKIYKNTSRP